TSRRCLLGSGERRMTEPTDPALPWGSRKLACTRKRARPGRQPKEANMSGRRSVLLVACVAALAAFAATPAAAAKKTPTTNLLFTFLTNQSGFDTAITIANTTADPFGTTPQAGTCKLNFFGAGAPQPLSTGSVAAGTVYTNLMSSLAPGFQGYLITQCNFPLGHRWAFVSGFARRTPAAG